MTHSNLRQWTVDAFASEPFRGNPACVVAPFDVWPDAAWMQSLAMENNQAETAYLCKTADPSRYGLRWFTPTMEAPLCGHATLASAHILFTEIDPTLIQVTFKPLSGDLTVVRDGAACMWYLPPQPPRHISVPQVLEASLGFSAP